MDTLSDTAGPQRHFEEKWQREGITDCVYELHDLAQVERVSALWAGKAGWKGMNVTVPHKQAILPLLDGISATAHAIGAVNTIAFTEAGRIGHNTDAHGFRRAIAPYLKGHHHRALILGTGGIGIGRASRAARHRARGHLRQPQPPALRAPWAMTHSARSAFSTRRSFVNCTPVGMHPNTADLPPLGGERLKGLDRITWSWTSSTIPRGNGIAQTRFFIGRQNIGWVIDVNSSSRSRLGHLVR